MADGHRRIFCRKVVSRLWWLLVFVLICFPSMVEIQIMCDMYMNEAGIPMVVTMSKE